MTPQLVDCSNAGMSNAMPADVEAVLGDIYQRESRRVFATLIRLVGDFDLAEDAVHEAFATAAAQWPRDGVPAN
ncbi:MAG: hypothetical protein KDA44_04430, partial [Planctomycetales bacterium]|nr:hypothetical protein [Planctomycetales bacterium]